MSNEVVSKSEQLAAKLQECLTPEERQIVSSAGYGKRGGWGERPALLIVDATYGFCGRTPKPILESIAEQRRSSGEGAWDAVWKIAAVLEQAREAQIPVIYSAMEDPSSPEYEPGLWRTKNRRGTEDPGKIDSSDKGENQVVAEIAPRPGELVFSKGKPSIFFGSGLLPYLISKRIDSLIICGGTTSGCVYASVVDGFSNNFKISVVADGCFDRIQSAHWMFLLDVDLKYGDVVTSEEAVQQLKSLTTAEPPGLPA
ncbi:Isochorismatase domain-containing protein [Hyphomicrobiales bacterium]|nr:Isochorismatase domain-containing protein [Hyphomicrobiales bacterium]CAH1677332.1 Isochorismatase domain-containing protein [Hyphomicrobiales bacterium]